MQVEEIKYAHILAQEDEPMDITGEVEDEEEDEEDKDDLEDDDDEDDDGDDLES